MAQSQAEGGECVQQIFSQSNEVLVTKPGEVD